MALFSFGKKNEADKPQEPGQEREYFKPMSQQQAAAPNPEHKEVLRLMALDACRKVDLDQAIRSCQVVGGTRGFSLLIKMHEHVDLTESQLIKRTQAFEKRCGVVADSRGIPLLDVYWGLPVSMLQNHQHSATGAESTFSVSQMADFAPSQMGASSAYYPDASLMPWDASDLPQIGEVRKAPRGPTGGRPQGSGNSKIGLSDE
ncbi:MAG: hypothetical protein ACH34Y_09905 [Brachymonas sp.]|jgi:hypothetical protein